MTAFAIKAVISGRVQGVGFRYSTQYEAEKLGVNGYARNLPDGDVEVVACGDKGQVLRLLEWLKRGPRTARVETLNWHEVPVERYTDFNIG